MTLHRLLALARLLLLPLLALASAASAQMFAASVPLLLALAYAACLTALTAWPRQSLRRVAGIVAVWLVLCWALALPHNATLQHLVAIVVGVVGCVLPCAMRDFQRAGARHQHMGLAELRIIRSRQVAASASRRGGTSLTPVAMSGSGRRPIGP